MAKDALERMIAEKPSDLLNVVASLIPKNFNIQQSTEEKQRYRLFLIQGVH